ncbi:MAG: EF-hand domain-containing protein [Mangrovibacterium sp.]
METTFSYRLKGILTGIACLSGTLLLDAQEFSFTYFDRNGDGLIQKEEFTAEYFRNYWNGEGNPEQPDAGSDNLYTAAFDMVDADHDRRLSEKEFDTAVGTYYQGYLENNFDAYDADGDSFISFGEYRDAVHDPDYFRFWDEDGDSFLTEDELAGRIFDEWDANGDGVLNRREFDNIENAVNF